MVYLSKIYTRSGDQGQTMLADGTRVAKNGVRIRSYGDVDELNACIGMVRLELGREPGAHGHEPFLATLDAQLAAIQQELFNLGAELATPAAASGGATLMVHQRHVDRLESEIDRMNEALEPLRSFILPGGGAAASAAHVARTVCRRAERELVTLAEVEPVRAEAVRYLNRLSDYLFVVSRAVAHELGYAETLWEPENV